jgi:hypothetical protein
LTLLSDFRSTRPRHLPSYRNPPPQHPHVSSAPLLPPTPALPPGTTRGRARTRRPVRPERGRGVVAEVDDVVLLPRRLRVFHALLPRHELQPPPFMNRQNPHSPSSSSPVSAAPSAQALAIRWIGRRRSWRRGRGRGRGGGRGGDGLYGGRSCGGCGLRGRGGGGGDSHGARVLWLRDRGGGAIRGAKLKPPRGEGVFCYCNSLR